MEIAEQTPETDITPDASPSVVAAVDPEAPVRLPFWTGLAVLPLAMQVGMVLVLVGLWVARVALGADPTASPWFSPVVTVLQDLLFLGIAIVLAYATVGVHVLRRELRRPRSPRVAFIGGCATYVSFVWVTLGLSKLVDDPSRDADPSSVLQLDRGLGLVVLTVFVAVIVAPLAEEMVFRGFIFSALRSRAGVVGGALLSGLIFGMMHLSSFTSVPDADAVTRVLALSFFGFGLALLCARTGSLLPGILVHSLNNAVVSAVSLQLDGVAALPLILGAPALCAGAFWLLRRRYADDVAARPAALRATGRQVASPRAIGATD